MTCFTTTASKLIDKGLLTEATMKTWTQTGPGRTGYDARCGCYCPGFRPEDVQLEGLRGTALYGVTTIANHSVCLFSCVSAAKCPPPVVCPPKVVCPPQVACPPQVPCPQPEPCPVCSPPIVAVEQPVDVGVKKDSGLFGPNVGMLAAGAIIGGVGYYGYKKGWFGKKKKR